MRKSKQGRLACHGQQPGIQGSWYEILFWLWPWPRLACHMRALQRQRLRHRARLLHFQRNWHALEFQASGVAGSVTTRIDLRKASDTGYSSHAASRGQTRVTAWRGQPGSGDGVNSKVHLLVGAGIETGERLWFNEDEGLPLQLTRIRQGSKPSWKQYRFGSERVYRVRKKPANDKEAVQSAEKWSRSSESFYPLPDGECTSVLESLQLIYLLSSPQYRISEASQTLCVFSRKHLYQVKLLVAEPGLLDVDYLQMVGDEKTRIREELRTISMVLKSVPLKGSAAAAKPFSFLGMKGDIHFLLSDPGRIPLQISGQVPGFGMIDLELRKLVGCAYQDCNRRSGEGDHDQTK